MGFWTSGRFVAVTAFIAAFPPIFTNFGKDEGMRLSLGILLLYLLRGLFKIAIEAGTASLYADKSSRSKRDSIKFLNKAVPLVLGAGYLGLQYIPEGWLVPYERMLAVVCPLFILAEGLAAMTVILSSGQLWSETLSEQPIFIKVVIVLGCLTLYLFSTFVIVQFYFMGFIKTVVSASLVAVLITLILILTILTIVVEHGTITDCSLLTLYLTYNLWIIARSLSSSIDITGPPPIKGLGGSVLGFLSQTVNWTSTFRNPSSLSSLVSTALSMFSVEIVGSLLIQMSIFLLLAQLYRRAQFGAGESIEEGVSRNVSQWMLAVLWPCFGKCLLIAMYTYSWLTFTNQTALPIYLDPIVWRWVNIFACIMTYVHHLLHPIEDEYSLKYD